ncbi:MAG: hypothetical protein GC162_17555 [Planctomycetes bacterium]|nr:hypothetical protein [Planctomycetota bacterium]
MIASATNAPPLPRARTLLRVALQHTAAPNPGSRSQTALDRWVDVRDGRTLVARSGQRYGRPTTFLSKLNWQFDPQFGLAIGAADFAGRVRSSTVPVTFAGHDGIYSRLDRSRPLGQALWLMSMLHEHGESFERMTPPLPSIYAVPPEGTDVRSIKLNESLITDALMRVARGEDSLMLERAPEAMFAAGDPESRSIQVRYSGGQTDTWVFPAGTKIKVPRLGCEVDKGRVIAHVVPREGWRGIGSMTPQAKQAARLDIVDQFTHHDVNGAIGYDLRLFNGPLPEGTKACLDTQSESEFLFDASPYRLVGHVGMIHFNFLSNYYDRRVPVMRRQGAPRQHSTLTSPLIGAA